MDAPNGISGGRLSRKIDHDSWFRPTDCRHGLVLFVFPGLYQVLVWDSVTDEQRRIAIPLGFQMDKINGAVVHAAGPVDHFQVVLFGNGEKDNARGLACVYSSKTGAWGNFISTQLPAEDSTGSPTFLRPEPPVLVGDSLYWLLSESILQFDLNRQSLAVLPLPGNLYAETSHIIVRVMRAEGGGLGLFFLSDCTAQLWKRKTNGDGVVSWVLGRTIELDKLLPLNSEGKKPFLAILAFAEGNHVVLLLADTGLFMVQLEELQFKMLTDNFVYPFSHYLPFESVFSAGIGIGGKHECAQVLLNTEDDYLVDSGSVG